MNDLTVRWLTAGDRAVAARVWQALDGEREGPTFCSSWVWTATWLKRYGARVDHAFACVERDGVPCAIALLVRVRRGRFGPVTAHLGTAGEPGRGVYVEDNRLCARPGEEDAVAAALAAALRARGGYDLLALDGMAEADARRLLAALGSARGATVRAEPSPYVDLAAARAAGHGADVLGALRSGPRSRVRRSVRAYGELDATWAQDPPTALAVLDELIALHQARWAAAGEPGAFADAAVVGFHRDLVAAAPDRTALLRVRDADGRTVGCLYGFVDAGRLRFYQGGLRAEEDNKRKPGLVCHALFLQACCDRGLDEYDLLAGESRYKRELATGEHTLVWATVPRPGVHAGLRRGRRAAGALRRRVTAA